MKIAGITRIADFPFNPVMAIKLSQYVDHLVLGFDAQGGYGKYNGTDYVDGQTWFELFARVNPFPSTVTADMFLCKTNAGTHRRGYYFNEELLRRLDSVRPDYVLECEADAHFDSGFEKDLARFVESGRDMLLMNCDTVTADGRAVPEFPIAAHCRAYKWAEGVTYSGAGGCCYVKYLDKRPTYFRAKTRLQHYPIFTRKLEKERWKYYGTYKVGRIYEEAKMPCPKLSLERG